MKDKYLRNVIVGYELFPLWCSLKAQINFKITFWPLDSASLYTIYAEISQMGPLGLLGFQINEYTTVS